MQKDPDEHIQSYTGIRLRACGLYCHHMDKIRPIIEKGFVQLQRNPEILETFNLEELRILAEYAEERKNKTWHSFEISTMKLAMIFEAMQKLEKKPVDVAC